MKVVWREGSYAYISLTNMQYLSRKVSYNQPYLMLVLRLSFVSSHIRDDYLFRDLPLRLVLEKSRVGIVKFRICLAYEGRVTNI